MNPTAWFDQFPTAGIGPSEQWCARHWAPAVIFGANGIGATIEMAQVFVDELAPTADTPAELDGRLAEVGRVCCALGDPRMYAIWGHWPPVWTIGQCSAADCGAPIVWALTEKGRRMPIDLSASPGGSITLEGPADHPTCRIVPQDERAGRADLRTSHFATCKKAATFRRRR